MMPWVLSLTPYSSQGLLKSSPQGVNFYRIPDGVKCPPWPCKSPCLGPRRKVYATVGPDTITGPLLYPGLFLVMFSIISMDFFQLEAAQAGYLMSFFGILQMVSGA